MKKPETQIRPRDRRPLTKATMDKPEEEFIAPEPTKPPEKEVVENQPSQPPRR
jgi:hypothetical protein